MRCWVVVVGKGVLIFTVHSDDVVTMATAPRGHTAYTLQPRRENVASNTVH